MTSIQTRTIASNQGDTMIGVSFSPATPRWQAGMYVFTHPSSSCWWAGCILHHHSLYSPPLHFVDERGCVLFTLHPHHCCYVRVPLERASAIGNTRVPLERVSVIGNTVQLNLWRGSELAKINCRCRCRCRCRSHAQWLAGAWAKAKRRGWIKTSRAERRRDLRSQARQEGKDVALLD